MSSSGTHLSRDYFDLVKSIGESRSKADEDKIISSQVILLKNAMSQSDVTDKQMREYLVRVIYCEMLGHDTSSYSYIHAVKQTSIKSSIIHKKIAYLTVCLTLTSAHPFILLLINSIQHDLAHDNYLVVGCTLYTICKLINIDTIPPILNNVIQCMTHREAYVRKKAIMCIQRFYQLDNTYITDNQPIQQLIRKSLCDSNISVMTCALNLLLTVCSTQHITIFDDLSSDLVSILKQVVEHRLPKDYDYHRSSAPFIQIKLLQLLCYYGYQNKSNSMNMYNVLGECIKCIESQNINNNISYSILYEIIHTVSYIWPNHELLNQCAGNVGRLLNSDNNNLRYVGITALCDLVRVDPVYAAPYQLVVIECMESVDITMQMKTLQLLVSMTNPHNVQVIVDTLIKHLNNSKTQLEQRTDLIQHISQLAEQYSTDNIWFINTMNTVLHAIDQNITQKLAKHIVNNVINVIVNSESSSAGDVRTSTVDIYIGMLQQLIDNHTTQYSTSLYQCIFYILGCYGHMSNIATVNEITRLIISTLSDKHVEHNDHTSISHGIVALYKLASKLDVVSNELTACIRLYLHSDSIEVVQHAREALGLLDDRSMLQLIDSNNNSNMLIDKSLSFLSNYIRQSGNGQSYNKPIDLLDKYTIHDDTITADTTIKPDKLKLNYTPYVLQKSTPLTSPTTNNKTTTPSLVNDTTTIDKSHVALPNTVVVSNDPPAVTNKAVTVPRKWGISGYIDTKTNISTSKPAVHNTTQPIKSNSASAAQSSVDINTQSTQPVTIKQLQSSKERLANSLFAGVGNTNKSIVNTAADNNNNKAKQAVQQQQTVDLLGFNDRPSSTVSIPTQTTQPVDALDLLFNNMSTNNDTNTPATTKPTTSATVDLFDNTSTAASVSATSPPASITGCQPLNDDLILSDTASNTSNKHISSNDDLFNTLMDNNNTQSVTDIKNNSLDFLNGSTPNNVLLSIQRLPQSPPIQLSNTITTYNAFADDALYTVLQFNDLINNIKIQVPNGVIVTFECDQPHTSIKLNNTAHNLTLASPCTLLLNLLISDITTFASTVRTLQLVLTTTQQYIVTYNICDFIRPSHITTDVYGTLWKQNLAEQRGTVNTHNITSNELFNTCTSKYHLYSVQTIGLENITAAQFITDQSVNTNTHYILVHGKINTAQRTIQLIGRSKLGALSSAVIEVLHKALM